MTAGALTGLTFHTPLQCCSHDAHGGDATSGCLLVCNLISFSLPPNTSIFTHTLSASSMSNTATRPPALGAEAPHIHDSKLGVPNPDAAKVFNSTINVTLDSWSPMMQLDLTWGEWSLNGNTGYREHVSSDRQSRTVLAFTFVGTGFQLRGSAQWAPGMGSADVTLPDPAELQLDTVLPTGESLKTVNVSGVDGLGSMTGLDLSSYLPKVIFEPGVDVVFHNVTLEIPIRTQA